MDTRTLTTLFEAGPLASEDVVRFRVDRRLGVPACADVEVRSATYAEADDLLGAPARLAFGREGAEHELYGVITRVEMVMSAEHETRQHLVYRLRVSSWLGLLAQQVDSRIFQDQDVQAIVSGVLADFGVDARRQSWRLVRSYPKREMCVQYDESALAFISRLLEEEGIYFFSAHDDDGEILVFEDDSSATDPIDGDSTIPYRFAAGLEAASDSIAVITDRRRTATNKVSLRDYDFHRPKLDLLVSASAADGDDLETYDYPGLYTDAKEGERLARVRLEALQAERATLELESACTRLVPGRWLELTEAPHELDGQYVITSAVHELAHGVYRVRATAIPKAVKFRAPQRTPRPVIDGPQTAKVVAPPGSPDEEIHTDALGRCKVLFHWDRYGKNDDGASCWIRVAQPQTSGSMILPRVGWEVVVEFLEGNPDRPIVNGRMYNGLYMPPYALPEGKTRTAVKTASSPGGKGMNEIRMEDKAGAEEIKIHAQKNTTLATGNNKTKSTGANETKNVGVDATLTVGANQTVQVTNGYENTVKAAQSVSVAGNRSVEVNAVYGLTSKGASATSVGGNQMEMVGSPIDALLSLAVKAATDAVKAEAAKAMQQLDAAVSAKVNQVMGPIQDLQSKADSIGQAMDAVSRGDLGAAAGAVSAAAGLPGPEAFGASLAGGGAAGASAGGLSRAGGGDGGGRGGAHSLARGGGSGQDRGGTGGELSRATGGGQGFDRGGGDANGRGGGERGGGGPVESGGLPSFDDASSQLGLDSLVNGALDGGADALGKALGLGGGGGGGSSLANKAGPDGAAGGNAASDSATGPGHAIFECSATHAEKVGSVKATIAAAGIHTTIKGARTQSVGAARVELVGGTRAESCLADKTEKAVGLVVVSKGAESEDVGGSRTTMVGGAILENIGGSCTIAGSGKVMLVGAFHKIDASGAIVFQCGGSEVVIDGGGIAIKAAAVTITAPDITLTEAVSEA